MDNNSNLINDVNKKIDKIKIDQKKEYNLNKFKIVLNNAEIYIKIITIIYNSHILDKFFFKKGGNFWDDIIKNPLDFAINEGDKVKKEIVKGINIGIQGIQNNILNINDIIINTINDIQNNNNNLILNLMKEIILKPLNDDKYSNKEIKFVLYIIIQKFNLKFKQINQEITSQKGGKNIRKYTQKGGFLLTELIFFGIFCTSIWALIKIYENISKSESKSKSKIKSQSQSFYTPPTSITSSSISSYHSALSNPTSITSPKTTSPHKTYQIEFFNILKEILIVHAGHLNNPKNIDNKVLRKDTMLLSKKKFAILNAYTILTDSIDNQDINELINKMYKTYSHFCNSYKEFICDRLQLVNGPYWNNLKGAIKNLELESNRNEYNINYFLNTLRLYLIAIFKRWGKTDNNPYNIFIKKLDELKKVGGKIKLKK
tara:strand:+ start:7249 stop:8538 length:1290 start_codon:yes stop_codon:yes gene_type:complete